MAGFPDHHPAHHALVSLGGNPADLYASIFSSQDGELSWAFPPAAHLFEHGGRWFQK